VKKTKSDKLLQKYKLNKKAYKSLVNRTKKEFHESQILQAENKTKKLWELVKKKRKEKTKPDTYLQTFKTPVKSLANFSHQ
jgi:hypothetical protein